MKVESKFDYKVVAVQESEVSLKHLSEIHEPSHIVRSYYVIVTAFS
jgi:hypothetical protein